MIRAAFLLIRTSLPSVLVLAFALVTLANLMSGEPEDAGIDAASSIPLLAPLPVLPKPAASAILQSALFDLGRGSETVSGSVDDLRSGTEAAASPVAIAGVLLSGGSRKAMLSLGGAAPLWNGIGAELGGWRVAAIDAEGAVIERDGQSVSLKVADRYKQRGKTQAAADETKSEPVTEGAGAPAAPPQPPDASLPPMP